MESGPYILVSRLGEGGMAEVFKAVKQGPDGWAKPIALKRILPHYADNPEFIRMLSAEARLHAHLDHPNVVQILDFFRQDNFYMIALEYVPGKNLRTLLRDAEIHRTDIPWQMAVHLISETLKGLDYAHRRRSASGPLNIVHRDVSPQNILVSYEGLVKLSDFGIAVANIDREKTETGILKGKHRYFAPEQLEKRAVDRRADLFSTGLVLYELLCKRHPFEDENQFQMMKKITVGDFQSSSELRKDIPGSIHSALDRALRREPESRFGGADEFRHELLKDQATEWLSHGTHILSEWMERAYPKPDDREEPLLEKTPILQMGTDELPQQIIPQESFISSRNQINYFSSSRRIGNRPLKWLMGMLVAAVAAFFTWKVVPTSVVPEARFSLPEPAPTEMSKGQLPRFGRLRVLGPDNAAVYLSGRFIGKLPLEPDKEQIATGSYIVTVKPKKGPAQSMRVTILAGQTKNISVAAMKAMQ